MFQHKIRIIGGKWKGRKIAIQHSLIRPTPNRVRETLFNWIMPNIQGARCLDLFAGSGALGLEALSRGASHATFVEREKRALDAIEAALQKLNATELGTTTLADALDWICKSKSTAPFDIVFIDPPFNQGMIEPVCKPLIQRGWVHPGTLIYVESERELTLSTPIGLELIRAGYTRQVSYRLYTVHA